LKESYILKVPEKIKRISGLHRHCVHRQVKSFIMIITSAVNHENLSGSEGGCVHWYLRKGYIDVFVASNFGAKQFT
jgi:hypothetical protein